MLIRILQLCLIVLSIGSSATNSQHTTNNDTKCKFGQFINENNTCIQCLLSCSRCTSLELPCAGCSEGFTLTDNNTKCGACSIGQQLCSQGMVKCQRYYTPDSNQCTPICVVTNCIKCVSIFAKQCQKCSHGHVLNANKTQCLPIIINQTESINNNTNNTNITNISRNLQQQRTPALLEQKFVLGVQSTNSTTVGCRVNQFQKQDLKCQRCNVQCSTCINSGEQCLSCSQGWVMLGWKCVTKQHLMYNVSLGVGNNQQKYMLGDGLNQIKNKIIQELLPKDYTGAGLKVLSISSIFYDQNSSSLNISGVIDRIGNISLRDVRNLLESKFKSSKSIGPFILLSSSVTTSQPATTTTTATSSVQTTPPPEKSQQPTTTELKIILIPSIILGVLVLVGLIVGCCKCCGCCCFKKQKPVLQNVQPYDSQRRATLSRQPQSSQAMPVITPLTPIRTQSSPTIPKSSGRIPTSSNGSLNLVNPVSQDKKIQKIVSMDSLDEMLNRNPPTKQTKMVLNKQQTLRQSQFQDNQIRSILPSSSNSKQSSLNKQEENNNVIVQADPRNLPENVKYYYVNQNGQIIIINSLPDHLRNQENLQRLNIKTQPKFIM